jgi:hypothetical protein
MIVVIVTYDHDIDGGQVFEFTGWRREPFKGFEVDRRAAILEYRIKQHAQTARELNVIACMAEPGSSQLRCFAG